MDPVMLIIFDDSEHETANEYLLGMHVVTSYVLYDRTGITLFGRTKEMDSAIHSHTIILQ